VGQDSSASDRKHETRTQLTAIPSIAAQPAMTAPRGYILIIL